MTAALMLSQPDLGMTVVISAIWFGQFFLAGLPMILVVGCIALGVFGLIGAYFLFPHVASRIDRFLDPSAGDSYPVDRSLEAFRNGGLRSEERRVGTGCVSTCSSRWSREN